MPIREYSCEDGLSGCTFCRKGFEQLEKVDQPALKVCPKCGTPIYRRISPPSFVTSKSSFDDRAKHAGFHKLKKLGCGEYEKQY